VLTNPEHGRLRTAVTALVLHPTAVAYMSIPLSLAAIATAWAPLAYGGLVMATASITCVPLRCKIARIGPAVLDDATRKWLIDRQVGHPGTAVAPDLAWRSLTEFGARADRSLLHRAIWRYSIAEIRTDASRRLHLLDPACKDRRREYDQAHRDLLHAADGLAEQALDSLVRVTLPALAASLAVELSPDPLCRRDLSALSGEQVADVVGLNHPQVDPESVVEFLRQRAEIGRVLQRLLPPSHR
jgi:hypothetical protein